MSADARAVGPAGTAGTAGTDIASPLPSPREDLAVIGHSSDAIPVMRSGGDLLDGSGWILGLSLLLVLALAAVAAWRKGRGPGRGSGGPARLRVVERLPLAARTSLYLVEVDGMPLLLGQQGDRLELLTGVADLQARKGS